MVRSIRIAAVVVGLAWTGLAGAQMSAQPGAAPRPRYMIVREEGKPPQRCLVLKTWQHTNGLPVFQVQAVDTGEVITVVGPGPLGEGGDSRRMLSRLYRWGPDNIQPEGAPVPPPYAPRSDSVVATSVPATPQPSATLLVSACLPVGQTFPAVETLPTAAVPANALAVNLDTVLRLTFQHNADILTYRERVNEIQIALDAALKSCVPEGPGKDTFNKSVAEATLWRRRVELRKNETDILQDASNIYFDWLATLRGVEIARDFLQHEEKLLARAQELAKDKPPVQVVVKAIQTAVNGRRQYILQTHQQSEALAAKLTHLMGMNGGALTPAQTLEPINRVDTSLATEVLVRQAQEYGPSVRELEGLIASSQQSLDEVWRAQLCCCRMGAALACSRVQAQWSLYSVQAKLRAGVEDAFAAVLSGREAIDLAVKAIDRAAETYRRMDSRLTAESSVDAMRNKTYDGVLNSIRQVAQANSEYITAVRDYDKAQARLLIMIGIYPDCALPNPPG
jgi:hypothetical protein